MRVLWVTTSMPHPLGAGGCVHEFELIAALAGRHDIHVIQSEGGGSLREDALLEAGARYTEVPWQGRPYPTSKLGVARGLIRAKPNLVHWLNRDRIDRLADAISTLSADAPPDVVHITHGELADVIPRISAPTALLLFDILTHAGESRRDVEPLFRRRLQLRLEHRRTRRFELHKYRRAKGIACVSSVDARWLERQLHRPIDVVENPIGDGFFESPSVARSEEIVAFVGALSHSPNADAIRWMADEIWPAVAARRPEARWLVVGRGDDDPLAATTLRRVVEQAGGELHQDVPDIRPYYWEAAVVVAPLRHGSGLRNKVIHAMAAQAPVVATPTALQGVPDEAARHAASASTAVDIVDAIVRVLDDPEGASGEARAAVTGLDRLRTAHVAGQLERWWATTAGGVALEEGAG